MFDFPQYVPQSESSRSPDPLGLGSTNMALYRDVFPGMNNRVRYIRVYSALCWMVGQIWDSLPEEPEDGETLEAFNSGLQKIQLLLVWANTRKGVPGLPGSQRAWPPGNKVGTLSYQSMRSRGAALMSDDEDDSRPKAGATLLAPDEYAPSITNGFRFLERHESLEGVFYLTDEGANLADAYAQHIKAKNPDKLAWFCDPYKTSIKGSDVDGFYELLRLDRPTQKERDAFSASFFPANLSALSAPDQLSRAKGLALALRAIAEQEKAQKTPGVFIPVEQIRHTMGRGRADDSHLVGISDLGQAPRKWESLQMRQYLKLALETFFRVVELRIHQAVVKSFQNGEDGQHEYINRDIDSIAAGVGLLAREGLSVSPAPVIGDLLKLIEGQRADASSLYLAGISNPLLDLAENMAQLRKRAKFNKVNGKEAPAAGSALFALLWLACEAKYLPEASLHERGDMLSLASLRRLTLENTDATVEQFVAMVVRDHVINLHFDVVRQRAEDDFNSRQMPKDRYRILLGDTGLERNLAANQTLSTPFVLQDTLLNALHFLVQLRMLTQAPGKREFALTDLGRARAACAVPGTVDELMSMDERELVDV
jgi:hypothetical protein